MRASRLRFKIHPTAILIIAFFIWNKSFAKLLLSVLLHEFGHALAAFLCGRRNMVLSLSPLGCSLYAGEIEGKLRGIIIYGAGPLVSLLLAPVLAPQTLWIFALNMLPILPLDGGRILGLMLGEKRAMKIGGYSLLFVLLLCGMHNIPPTGIVVILILLFRYEMSSEYAKIKRAADFLTDLY